MDDRVYLPASSHALWVAYFEEDNLRTLGPDDPVLSVVLLEPVIGWVIPIHGEWHEDVPIPMTPDHGPLGLSGFHHRVGVSDVGVRKEACRAAETMRAHWAAMRNA